MHRAFVAFLAAGGLACHGTQSVEPSQLLVTLDAQAIVYEESFSGLATEAAQVITTPAAWAAAWGRIHANLTPVPPLPSVDFSTSALVLDALGAVTDGRRTTIVGVDVHASGVVVRSRTIVPGAGCAVLGVVLHPVSVAQVSREMAAATVIGVQRTSEVHDCG